MTTIVSDRPLSSLFLLLSILYFVSSIHSESLLDHHKFPYRVLAQDIRFDSISQRHHSKRFLLEGNEGKNSSLILAADRTRRKDPLDHFRYYTGGWNFSNNHYFASVAYTSAPLVITAAIWFVAIGICLLLSCIYFICCRHRRYGYSKVVYACSVIFLILFTVVAIVGSIILYIGQGKFHNSTTKTIDYVVHQADYTVSSLKNVSAYLNAAKQAGVDQVFLPQSVQNGIDKVASQIDSAASTLETETKKNKDGIQSVLKTVRILLIIVASVMLVVALLGYLLSIFGLQVLIYILVVIAWILVAATFVLAGVFLVFHNATADTCLAMEQWAENPTAHTTLDDILPCVDPSTTQQSLNQSKDVIYQLVQGINLIITTVPNIDPPPSIPLISYNQSGPLMPTLCNPLNSDRTERKCDSGEQDISTAIQDWKNFVCQVSSDDVCITVGRLRPAMYDQLASVVNITYGLYHYGPFLTNLADCDFVRETFDAIHDDYCPKLRRYSELVYIGLVLVSAAVALSLIFWLLNSRERRHRKYAKSAEAAPSGSFI